VRPITAIFKLLSPILLVAMHGAAKPRIAIAQFSHESNSFNPSMTAYGDFSQRPLNTVDEWRKNKDEIAGYLEGADKYQFEVVPVLLAIATPKGPVTDDAMTRITAAIIRGLKNAGKLDGLLLALHGAMVGEKYPHGDVEVLRRIREAMGPAFPIVVTHDFHANVSPRMTELSTALVTYKEVPHTDMKECGLRAARIIAGTVSGEFKPTQAIAKPPMIYNIIYHQTSRAPLLPIVSESKRLEQNPKILAASVPGGYQYADVPQVGPSVIVVTNNDPALARREAERLSNMLWATRTQMTRKVPEAPEAISMAMKSAKQPVVLVDMGDNIGGGSSGDSTFLLSELIKQKAMGWTVVIADPKAVQAAARAGIGAKFDLAVGGKMDNMHGKPVRVSGVVKSLHDGKYIEPEVRHGGQTFLDQGLTAVIQVEGGSLEKQNLLMLTTKRQVPFSIHQLVGMGIYPERQKIIVVKAAVAFRAAYEPVAGEIIEVDTAGATAVNTKRFTYKNARRPLFGLDQ
jgi:microcystin degradation protein MlrC